MSQYLSIAFVLAWTAISIAILEVVYHNFSFAAVVLSAVVIVNGGGWLMIECLARMDAE